LKDISRSYVFLGAFDRIDKALPRRSSANPQFAGRLLRRLVPVRRAQARGQLLFQDGNVGGGAIIGPSRTLARDIGVGDDVNLVAQVIECQ